MYIIYFIESISLSNKKKRNKSILIIKLIEFSFKTNFKTPYFYLIFFRSCVSLLISSVFLILLLLLGCLAKLACHQLVFQILDLLLSILQLLLKCRCSELSSSHFVVHLTVCISHAVESALQGVKTRRNLWFISFVCSHRIIARSMRPCWWLHSWRKRIGILHQTFEIKK